MLFSAMTNELRNSRRDYKRIKRDKVHLREVKEKQKKKEQIPDGRTTNIKKQETSYSNNVT